jgi:hypothetical protein
MEKMLKQDEKRLLLRMPNKLFELVKKRSVKNNRSINKQILHELQEK